MKVFGALTSLLGRTSEKPCRMIIGDGSGTTTEYLDNWPERPRSHQFIPSRPHPCLSETKNAEIVCWIASYESS
jgi:hypothetical protein